jgi:hypothetical protein
MTSIFPSLKNDNVENCERIKAEAEIKFHELQIQVKKHDIMMHMEQIVKLEEFIT